MVSEYNIRHRNACNLQYSLFGQNYIIVQCSGWKSISGTSYHFPRKKKPKSIDLPISIPLIFNNYWAGLETRQRGQSVVYKEYLSYCNPFFILNTTRARECNYLLSLTKNTIISETMNGSVCYTPPLSILYIGGVSTQTKTNFAAIMLFETKKEYVFQQTKTGLR